MNANTHALIYLNVVCARVRDLRVGTEDRVFEIGARA